MTTYAIRSGDDGHWIGSYTAAEVTVCAMVLADDRHGNAQIRNNETHELVGLIRESRWIKVANEIRWY